MASQSGQTIRVRLFSSGGETRVVNQEGEDTGRHEGESKASSKKYAIQSDSKQILVQVRIKQEVIEDECEGDKISEDREEEASFYGEEVEGVDDLFRRDNIPLPVKEEVIEDDVIDEEVVIADFRQPSQDVAKSVGVMLFQCQTCDYTTLSDEELQRHLSAHYEEKPHRCDLCAYSARRSEKLAIHRKSKHGVGNKKQFNCEVCPYKAFSAYAVGKHMRKHTGEKPFECSICKGRFRCKENLQYHKQIKHQQFTQAVCKKCDYQTCCKLSLASHEMGHMKQKPFKCEICDFSSPIKNNLIQHMKSSHGCSDKWICEVCEFKACCRHSLINHALIHKGEKVFHCDICDFSASSSRYLSFHLMRKHAFGNAESIYECEICGYRTGLLSYFTNHVKLHFAEKPHKCNLCDFSTATKTNLNIHLKNRHEIGDVKPFQCQMCDYQSYYSSSIKKHIRTHIGDRRYECDMCDYAAVEKKALSNHKQAKHRTGDELMYQCELCGYRTHIRDYFRAHMKGQHSGEKPYACDMCDYKTAYCSSIAKHNRKHGKGKGKNIDDKRIKGMII